MKVKSCFDSLCLSPYKVCFATLEEELHSKGVTPPHLNFKRVLFLSWTKAMMSSSGRLGKENHRQKLYSSTCFTNTITQTHIQRFCTLLTVTFYNKLSFTLFP